MHLAHEHAAAEFAHVANQDPTEDVPPVVAVPRANEGFDTDDFQGEIERPIAIDAQAAAVRAAPVLADLLEVQLLLHLTFVCEGRTESRFSHLVGWQTDEYLIVECPARAMLAYMDACIVRCVKDGNIMEFETTVVAVHSRPKRLVYLAYPQAAQRVATRSHRRVSTHLKTVVYPGNPQGRSAHVVKRGLVAGVIHDLSRGGCSIALTGGLPDHLGIGLRRDPRLPGRLETQRQGRRAYAPTTRREPGPRDAHRRAVRIRRGPRAADPRSVHRPPARRSRHERRRRKLRACHFSASRFSASKSSSTRCVGSFTSSANSIPSFVFTPSSVALVFFRTMPRGLDI